LRTRRQPRKKNTPCFSVLAGVKFILKKEKVFFFRGSAQEVSGQCGGAKCGTRTAREEGFEGRNPAPSSLQFDEAAISN